MSARDGGAPARPAGRAHERLAEKFMHRRYFEGVPVPDSMRALVALAFTEEEAEVVLALGFAPLPARVVAGRLRRPVSEVRPLLDSLSARLLIVGVTVGGIRAYGFLNFVPGLFEAQMIRAKRPASAAERAFFVRFAELYEQSYDEVLTWLRPRVEGKDLRFGRIVPIDAAVDTATGILPATGDLFAEIVDRNKSFCLVDVCACRHEMVLLGKGCGKPMDVCSAMGWLADFCIDKGLARRVSKEEFLEAKGRAAEAGLVHLTDNLADPMQVCSCCSCCCSALRILKDYNIPTIIAASRFEAVVEDAKCNACAKCVRVCPMEAISWKKKEPPVKIDYARCIGCGVCVGSCDKELALSMRERPSHVPPSETVADYFADRYLEMSGGKAEGLPRLQLGLGRALAKLSPFSVSGPGYAPRRG